MTAWPQSLDAEIYACVILAQCAILGHFLSLLPKQHAREKCRTTSVKSPWRAYLDLDFRVTEKRRSNKVLDTLKKEYRGTSTAYRGQHKTRRGVGVFVVVDLKNFFRSPKTFHQSRELTPVAQTVDFESH